PVGGRAANTPLSTPKNPAPAVSATGGAPIQRTSAPWAVMSSSHGSTTSARYVPAQVGSSGVSVVPVPAGDGSSRASQVPTNITTTSGSSSSSSWDQEK